MRFPKFILLNICLLIATTTLAQRGDVLNSPYPNDNTYGQDTFPINDSIPFVRVSDSVSITYIFAKNPNQEFIFSDSLLDRDFQQYDAARKRALPYANLGSIGTASRPIVYELRDRRAFDMGLHQYDIYKGDVDDIRYFTLAPAYTNAKYSQGSQNDSNLDLTFSRKFDDGMSLSLGYHRLIHAMEDDELRLNQNAFYKFQAARHTVANIGLWYNDKKGRYDAFLSFMYNQNQQIDHGGIVPGMVSDSILLNGNNIEQTSVPIYQGNETTNTRYDESILNFTHHYRFGGAIDTLGKVKRSFTLSHEATYQTNTYKFSDTNPDSVYYENFYTDSRGLRQFVDLRSIENEFSISTFRANSDRKAIKSQKDLLKVGLLHRYNQIYQEPVDTTIQNLFLTGQLNFTPNDRLQINTYAHLGLWNQAGDYQIKGDLFLDLGLLGKLKLFANQQLYEPSLIQTRNYVSERLVWNQDWKKTLETQLGGAWSRPEWDLSITANYFLLNNYIYFDKNAQSVQYDRAFSIGQLIVQKDFRMGKFHLDNTIALQQNSATEVLRMPAFFTKNSLYFEGYIFKKKMFTRTGFDFILNSTYLADSYQILTGQFHLQDDRNVQAYPNLDFFFNFKVDRFRFFVKVENLTSLLTTDIYYQTPYYPQKELYFRFGIAWVFLDAPSGAKQKNNNSGGGRPGQRF